MKTAIIPGTFDPITLGHLHLISKASNMCDSLIIAVANSSPKNPLFTLEERIKMVEDSVENFGNVKVLSYNGLLVDFAKEVNANILIRGLRGVSDFEYEFNMAILNNRLDKNIETVFILSNTDFVHLSSTQVRELCFYGGDVKQFVPNNVYIEIIKKFEKK